MEKPFELNRWVNDNNPSPHLQFVKGWWDYIEIVRRLALKFGLDDAAVVGTYIMNTPPPEEELTMPIFRLRSRGYEFILKWDFGIVPEAWTVSLTRPDGDVRSTYGLFDESEQLRSAAARGLSPEWIYPPYRESPARFSCELPDEWDLASFVCIMARPVG